MQEMIAVQPALVEALLDSAPPGTSAAAVAIAAALGRNLPVIVCGCGTSVHAAHGIAALLSAAVDPAQSALVRARPAVVHLMTRSAAITGHDQEEWSWSDDRTSMRDWWALVLGHGRAWWIVTVRIRGVAMSGRSPQRIGQQGDQRLELHVGW
jgi:hypothetical protein